MGSCGGIARIMNPYLAAALAIAAIGSVVPDHFVAGFTHILPGGLDHVLFLLALFFLTRKPNELLLQLTLFTIAHSLTLGLSHFGWLSVPERIVETAIALSIVFVAAENLWKEGLSPWRTYVVFAAGLVHGMGFAHSFGQLPTRPADFLPALMSFNIGIEAGQIAVICIAFAATAAWTKHRHYRSRIARPASAAIALAGICWTVGALL
jgi:hypothetical protein